MDFQNSVNGNIFIYVHGKNTIVSADFGTGDNLFQEDIDAGYNAYINYYEYDLSDILIQGESDGGMMLYNSKETDYMTNLYSLVTALLQYIYNEALDYSIICAPAFYKT